jgi:NADH-quinone oxidoreductase subunit C
MTIQEIFDHLQTKLPDVELTLDEIKPDGAIHVKAGDLLEVCKVLLEDDQLQFSALMCLSGVETVEHYATVYHLHSMSLMHKVTLVCGDSKENEVHMPSVAGIWAAADWHEREAYDMFGIIYDDHPDFRRILCPDDWEGYPLRKDYVPQEKWHNIPLTSDLPPDANIVGKVL